MMNFKQYKRKRIEGLKKQGERRTTVNGNQLPAVPNISVQYV